MMIVRAQGKRVKVIMFAMYNNNTDSQEPNILLRPWYMFWFMSQIYRSVWLACSISRESGAHNGDFYPSPSALTLWKHDNSLTIALDVCKAYLELIEYIIKFYPGPGTCHISHFTL